MDTDGLSRETYEGIIIEAERLSHDLTLHFGLLSFACINETSFIHKSEKLSIYLMHIKDHELYDLFWGNPPEKEKLHFSCKKILENIKKIRSLPIEKRKFDF